MYRFYTDLENPNVMDEAPFFEFNLLDIKDAAVLELKKFHKLSFDIDTVFNTASELKYAGQIKQYLSKQLSEPEDNFVNFLLGEVYSGRKTQSIIEKFRGTVKNSFKIQGVGYMRKISIILSCLIAFTLFAGCGPDAQASIPESPYNLGLTLDQFKTNLGNICKEAHASIDLNSFQPTLKDNKMVFKASLMKDVMITGELNGKSSLVRTVSMYAMIDNADNSTLGRVLGSMGALIAAANPALSKAERADIVNLCVQNHGSTVYKNQKYLLETTEHTVMLKISNPNDN